MRKIVIFVSSVILIGAQQTQGVLSKNVNNDYTNLNIAKSSGNSSFNSLLDSVLVSVFAGSDSAGSADGIGTLANFNGPTGQAIDTNGNLFIADALNHLIRKITPSGVVTTFAGSGTAGSTNGTGTEASFNTPTDLDFDSNGNLFVTDFANHLIRKITPAGIVTTFAGTGEAGSNNNSVGDGSVFSLSFDGVDDYVRVNREVQDDFTLQAWVKTTTSRTGTKPWEGLPIIYADLNQAPNLDFSTAVLNGKFSFSTGPSDETIQSTSSIDDGQWHHVVATREKSTGTISVYVNGALENTLVTTNTESLITPTDIYIGGQLTDNRFFKGNIKEVAVWTSTISSNGVAALYNSGSPLNALADAGNYTSSSSLQGYWQLNDGSGLTAVDASTSNNHGYINGAFWESESGSNSLPISYSYAGRTISFNTVSLNNGDNIISVKPGDSISISVEGTYTHTSGYCPGCIVQIYARMNDVFNLCLFSGGTSGGGSFSGTTTFTVPTTPGTYYVNPTGSLDYSCVDSKSVSTSFNANTLATIVVASTEASFNYPFGIAIYKKGGYGGGNTNWANNLFITDYGNELIRMITNGNTDERYNGIATTFAGISGTSGAENNEVFSKATFDGPVGIAWDKTHTNLFISEWYGHTIRKINTGTGSNYGVSTFAGSGAAGSADGIGTEASFDNPVGITIDENENLYVADSNNNLIRKITFNGESSFSAGLSGIVSTYAGSGIAGTVNGSASVATFYGPYGVEMSQDNRSLYVTDFYGNTIRKVIANFAPVINTIDDVTINEDESTTISLSATDLDGDSISFIVSADERTELSFDGEDDFVKIPDIQNLNFGTDDFTYSAWFNTESVDRTSPQQILHKRSNNNYEVQLSGDWLTAYIGEPGNENSLSTTSKIVINTWYHVLISRINGVATMYLNGNKESSVTASGSVTTSDPLYIGSDTGSEDFIGLIKDVAIWSYGLSDSAATTIYNNGTPIDLTQNNGDYTVSDRLQGYWRLDDKTAIAKDLSGSGNNGTINGAIWMTAGSDFITSTISGSSLTLLPDPNWNGKSTITVIANDQISYDSTTFILSVTPIQDLPTEFEWISQESDSIYVTQDSLNLEELYTLEWSVSEDVDNETIKYIVNWQIGTLLSGYFGEISYTTLSLTNEENAEGPFDLHPYLETLPRLTVYFSVYATDGIDTVKVNGNDRVLFVNRYEYLSTESDVIPTEYALYENFPNPFNPSTTLRFDLPYSGDVYLTIYNMLGQKVKSFDMRGIQVGKHTLKWNATNDFGEKVGTGVYLYQLQTKDFMKTRKMIFMK